MTDRLLVYRFAAQAEQLAAMRQALREALQTVPASEKQRDDWVLAVNEACMNIIQHAYRQHSGAIDLQVQRKDLHLWFELRDQAPAIDTGRLQPRDLEQIRPGGLGLHFIYSIMDEVRFIPDPSGRGNCLVMQVDLQETHST